jgi:8-oxo-dGTP pyrophosphatase MutT (NUDIX family)
VQPRPAATVVVARDGAEGVEVLVLERSAASRFAPGFVVFPGGALEPGDESLARRWYGTTAEAARACGVRELYEETGILATSRGLVARPDRPRDIEQVEFDPLSPEAMPEMARWIAPEFLPVRFDARFYALAAPPGLEPEPDGIEIGRGWWAEADTVVAQAAAGEAPLMWPTFKTLQALRECLTVADVLALHVPQVEPRPEEVREALRLQGGRP